ncbi:MAG: AbrB/MazE/SpoVT family DNA-binding domain-containing protein [Syntrophomonas sp.]|uniref:AbrB/MazE/SpoVT family DNA-binding domain-containing protein n=1 Tax=Syntrophomonas sp. TaxID=2053627 RepID=UPI002613D374|nr:AbrB/MazE/SpoVT family DNA-binding domain-containing protein [Syntrophomonas sp.]MDD2510191.1 AbrB/MazE/SpoVT family DNA-binding domain-containing protein [Syntrophomonas sp.]MDD3880021.1 AbrB/MazE/SpoVT family DNA-binding domain-containing protein [Syntrophomonas sp.]MDD4625798.1 AbrB/MazE/SpoVT family DNA-binding domain-containing protein [Syntrophomonas sp.]
MSKRVISKKVQMRERGQFTIPVEFRRRLDIKDNSLLRVCEIGRALVLYPENTVVNELARQVEYGLKQADLKLEELLSELREGNHEYEIDPDIS